MAATSDNGNTRQKWDARYRDSHSNANNAAEVLLQNQPLLPAQGRALDLACGLGGNALFLATRGLEVHAWDISPVAIDILNTTAEQRGVTIHTQNRDCVARPPETASFDLIIVSCFLERNLCPAISAALTPNGLLFYQTYTQTKQSNDGPKNPHFLLAPAELPLLFTGLDIVFYNEGEEALFIGKKPAASRRDARI
jgi:tellurite methyltransferase